MDGYNTKLIICHDCDLLQREIPLKPGCSASCRRCGALLYRNATDSVNRTLAYSIAAAILFLIANAFPIFAIEVHGSGSSIDTNLIGAVLSLWDLQMRPISLLVFFTTILIPSVELATMITLLISLKMRRLHVEHSIMLRLLRIAGPWGMIEVFMLGVLVSLVKLTSSFKVIPGVALWSFGALTLLLAAAAASFSARDVWTCLDENKVNEASA